MNLKNKTILINSLGIQDSGGITVLGKLLDELKNSSYTYLIVCNKNSNIENLKKKFDNCKNLKFKVFISKGFLHRLYYENVILRKVIKKEEISLIYNFSGTAQFFLKIPQITKIHNLLFYSKKIDSLYFEKKEYLSWLKQIFVKRLVFHTLIKQSKYIEVQSNHVKENISDFINISNKSFFIKSDIDIKKSDFNSPKEYNFKNKIKFLFIVGPHFKYLHKNFKDFVDYMKLSNNNELDFEIVITLSKEELYSSDIWDKSLDNKTNFLGYISKDELKNQFQDNTILISTSIIETLGLHVIESIQNAILTIVPNESYSKSVYGNEVLTYDLFNIESLLNTIDKIISLNNNDIKDIIIKNQKYLIENETKKYQNIVDVFNEILKEKNV